MALIFLDYFSDKSKHNVGLLNEILYSKRIRIEDSQ